MSDIFILEGLQKFLQENVTSKLKFQKPTGKISEYVLVNPSAHIGWIPPKLPDEWKTEDQVPDIPCLLVGMDEGNDDGEDSLLSLRLSFIVYSPGNHEVQGNGSVKFTPDFQGYKDLLNFITKTKQELIRSKFINGITVVNHPFKWGMYKDQLYPYWYGWLTFSARLKPGLYVQNIAQQYL